MMGDLNLCVYTNHTQAKFVYICFVKVCVHVQFVLCLYLVTIEINKQQLLLFM